MCNLATVNIKLKRSVQAICRFKQMFKTEEMICYWNKPPFAFQNTSVGRNIPNYSSLLFKALSTNITGASEGLNQIKVVNEQLKYTIQGKTASHTWGQCSIHTIKGKKWQEVKNQTQAPSKTGLKAVTLFVLCVAAAGIEAIEQIWRQAPSQSVHSPKRCDGQTLREWIADHKNWAYWWLLGRWERDELTPQALQHVGKTEIRLDRTNRHWHCIV